MVSYRIPNFLVCEQGHSPFSHLQERRYVFLFVLVWDSPESAFSWGSQLILKTQPFIQKGSKPRDSLWCPSVSSEHVIGKSTMAENWNHAMESKNEGVWDCHTCNFPGHPIMEGAQRLVAKYSHRVATCTMSWPGQIPTPGEQHLQT
jgi:hypothetical protein